MKISTLVPKLGDLMRMPRNTSVVYAVDGDPQELSATVKVIAHRTKAKATTAIYYGCSARGRKAMRFLKVTIKKTGTPLKRAGRSKG